MNLNQNFVFTFLQIKFYDLQNLNYFISIGLLDQIDASINIAFCLAKLKGKQCWLFFHFCCVPNSEFCSHFDFWSFLQLKLSAALVVINWWIKYNPVQPQIRSIIKVVYWWWWWPILIWFECVEAERLASAKEEREFTTFATFLFFLAIQTSADDDDNTGVDFVTLLFWSSPPIFALLPAAHYQSHSLTRFGDYITWRNKSSSLTHLFIWCIKDQNLRRGRCSALLLLLLNLSQPDSAVFLSSLTDRLSNTVL